MEPSLVTRTLRARNHSVNLLPGTLTVFWDDCDGPEHSIPFDLAWHIAEGRPWFGRAFPQMPAVYVTTGISRFAADLSSDFGGRGEYPLMCGDSWDLCLDYPKSFAWRCAAYRRRFGVPKSGPQHPVRLFPFATCLPWYSQGKLLDEFTRAINLVRAYTGEQHVLLALDWIESEDALIAARSVADRTGATVVVLAGEHRNDELSPIVDRLADDVIEVHERDEFQDLPDFDPDGVTIPEFEVEPHYCLDGVKGCIGFRAGYTELGSCVVQRF